MSIEEQFPVCNCFLYYVSLEPKSDPLKYMLSFFLFSQFGCQINKQEPYFKKDLTSKSERENTLFVFVGEKLSTNELAQDSNSWDGKYHGKYKVLERIYGDYKKDIIDFTAYDHYGIPEFSLYKNVLLFVSEKNGEYYHEKYLTDKNKWASPYKIHDNSKDKKPEKINFLEKISYPILKSYREYSLSQYPQPFYKIIGDSAFPIYGNYVDDLFHIKKEGTLKWRGLFGKGDKNWSDSLLETHMDAVK